MLKIHGNLWPNVIKVANIADLLDFGLDACVSFAIACRLWYMGSKARGAGLDNSRGTTSSNRYMSTIIIVVESGVIGALAKLIDCIMNLCDELISNSVYYPMAQLTVRPLLWLSWPLTHVVDSKNQVTAPLLIIVRVGFGIVHPIPAFNRPLALGSSARQEASTLQFAQPRVVVNITQQTQDFSAPETDPEQIGMNDLGEKEKQKFRSV